MENERNKDCEKEYLDGNREDSFTVKYVREWEEAKTTRRNEWQALNEEYSDVGKLMDIH